MSKDRRRRLVHAIALCIGLVVLSSITTVAFIATAPHQPVAERCSTDKPIPPVPPASTNAPTIDPETGLMGKDTRVSVGYMDGLIPSPTMAHPLGDAGFGKFLEACGTTYSIEKTSLSETTLYMSQAKYNYIIEGYGLDVRSANGVPLSTDAVSSLGLPLLYEFTPLPSGQDSDYIQYTLAPTK